MTHEGGGAAPRRADVRRETGETAVEVSLNLDGAARYDVSTGSLMLDHLIDQLGRHSGFDLTVRAQGKQDPDGHHTAEDVGIVIGRALAEALGDRTGIRRMAHAMVPLDDALITVAVDLSGRGYAVVPLRFTTATIGDLRSELITHVLESIARESRINLHVIQQAGSNDHHIAEAAFKAFAKALDAATRRDERFGGVAPSTKGTLTD